jgi:hypothetical protein
MEEIPVASITFPELTVVAVTIAYDEPYTSASSPAPYSAR